MVIHTKEKTKLHIKQEPEAKIKGRNVLVVDKSPKIAGMDKEDKTVIKKSSAKEAVKNSMQKEKGMYAQVQKSKQDREKYSQSGGFCGCDDCPRPDGRWK